MIRALLCLTLALLAMSAHSEGMEPPAVVGLHVMSAHADAGSAAPGSRGWNNLNPGIYARWSNGFTAGLYRNSVERASAYVGWTFADRADRFALTVGVVSGYDRMVSSGGDHKAVRCEQTCRTVSLKSVYLPFIAPSARIGITDRTSARLSLLVPPSQPAVVHLSIERRF